MIYSSTETFPSQSVPGVSFTLKKRSAGRRARFNLAIAPLTQKLQTLQSEGELAESKPCPTCTHEVSKHNVLTNDCQQDGCNCKAAKGQDFETRMRVMIELSNVDHDEIQPRRIREFLKSLDGLEIDGQAATADTLLSDGPEDLVDEIDAQIKKLLTLSESERKNSESPTTSGAVAE